MGYESYFSVPEARRNFVRNFLWGLDVCTEDFEGMTPQLSILKWSCMRRGFSIYAARTNRRTTGIVRLYIRLLSYSAVHTKYHRMRYVHRRCDTKKLHRVLQNILPRSAWLRLSASLLPMSTILGVNLTAATFFSITIHSQATLHPQKLKATRIAGEISDPR